VNALGAQRTFEFVRKCRFANYCWPVVNSINILRAAFALIFFAKKSQSQTVIREKLHKALPYEKGTREMLMKLAPDHRRLRFVLAWN
jgi:hypothetical protein